MGDRLAADVRLIEVRGLKVDEAALTGESVAVDKSAAPVMVDAPLGDRTSMAYSGTLVAAGQGRGVVVATGADTELGRISGLLAGTEPVSTPLTRQMDRFARWLTFAIVGAGALVLACGLKYTDYAFAELFMNVVGLSVAAIPEGLPAILTVTLAIGVQGMAQRNAIVRRLPAIEALGAINVICSDKTGTLTRNEMTVTEVAAARETFAVTGAGYAPEGDVLVAGTPVEPSGYPVLRALAEACALCNDAEVRAAGGTFVTHGDPMEGALVVFAAKAGVDVDALRVARPRIDVIPFDAAHRFMVTLNDGESDTRRAFLKGATEVVIARCTHVLGPDGRARTIDIDDWRRRAEALTERGQRVLAVASRPRVGVTLGHVGESVLGLVTLVGLVTIAVSTYLITYSYPIYRRLEPLLAPFERLRVRKETAGGGDGPAGDYPDVLLFGLGRYGLGVAHHLRLAGYRVAGIDLDPGAVRRARAAGFVARYGDATDPEFLVHLPIGHVRWALCAIPSAPAGSVVDDPRRALLAALADARFPGRIAVASHDASSDHDFEAAGAALILRPYDDAAREAAVRVAHIDGTDYPEIDAAASTAL